MIFLIALFPYVIGTEGLGKMGKADRICSSYGYKLVEGHFDQETHLLCLKMEALGSFLLTTASPILLLDPGPDNKQKNHHFSLRNITMVHGFPVEGSSTGSAEGYIGDDNNFYGVLHLGNRTLQANPHGKNYNPSKFIGAFENDNMAAPKRPTREYSQIGTGFDHLLYFPYVIEERYKKPGIARARICDLLLLADKEFYVKDANSSLNHAVRRMLHSVAQADIIFRNTDFNEDGIPDNVGFSVKYIVVLTSNETDTRMFGDLTKRKTVDGRSYLMKFARLRRLSEVCLGVAFSGHAFQNKTLGLSFTSLGGGMGGAAGGLCDRRAYGRSFNTLALAHATVETNQRVPEEVAALTLAHEMGHSFGAHHDDNFPNPDCEGYIMGSQSSVTSSHRFEFSKCSKRLVTATLSSMSYCLSAVDEPYCGNGIVEEGEACDCGLPSQCTYRDPCCTARAGAAVIFEEGALHKEGCSVSPSAMCHPSQGLCCNANCEYANFSKSGIDCLYQDVQCMCGNITSKCRCGLGGRCLHDGSCHAAECAILGLKECKCPENGPGGKLHKQKKCGLCCLVKKGETEYQCVGVEQAARKIMKYMELPSDWPDEYYNGPNTTIKICNIMKCKSVRIRAWSPGDVCVSMNSVGVCSPQAVCEMVTSIPTLNIYPDFVKVNVMRHSRQSAIKIEECLTILLISVISNIFK